MVRTQLYLPEDLYTSLKKQAAEKNMTFAAYVRIYLEREVLEKKGKKKTLSQKFPFMKFAGAFSWRKNASDNEEIDKAIYDL